MTSLHVAFRIVYASGALPAQIGSNPWVEGAIFAVLAGAVLFAVCRSSRRN